MVAVTTDTLLGVAIPVTVGGVVVADAVLLDPLQPVSRPATSATQAMLRSLVRNLLNVIFELLYVSDLLATGTHVGSECSGDACRRPTIERLSTRYLYLCGEETWFTLGA